MAVAMTHAKVIEKAKPMSISCAVTDACRRNSDGLSASSASISDTGGNIQVWTFKHSDEDLPQHQA